MPFYRGVIHVHSTLSDGELTPEEVRDKALAEGLSFVVLGEHSWSLLPGERKAASETCSRLSDDAFALILGVEFSHHGRHVLLSGPPDVLVAADDESVVASPERVRAHGGLTIWAHPAATDALGLGEGTRANYDGWEVWNGFTDGAGPSLPIAARLARERARGRRLLAFGGSDLHYDVDHPFRVLTEVEAPALTPGQIAESLRKGSHHVLDSTSGQAVLTALGDLPRQPLLTRARSVGRYALLRAGGGLGSLLGCRVLAGIGSLGRWQLRTR